MNKSNKRFWVCQSNWQQTVQSVIRYATLLTGKNLDPRQEKPPDSANLDSAILVLDPDPDLPYSIVQDLLKNWIDPDPGQENAKDPSDLCPDSKHFLNRTISWDSLFIHICNWMLWIVLILLSWPYLFYPGFGVSGRVPAGLGGVSLQWNHLQHTHRGGSRSWRSGSEIR